MWWGRRRVEREHRGAFSTDSFFLFNFFFFFFAVFGAERLAQPRKSNRWDVAICCYSSFFLFFVDFCALCSAWMLFFRSGNETTSSLSLYI